MADTQAAEILPKETPHKFDKRHEQRLINDILELLVTHHGGGMSEDELDENIELFQHAIELGRTSHVDQLRKSGEPYFFHPLRVAHLAARHWMGFPSVIAALLHDVVEDTPVTLSQVKKRFGNEVALLVNGLTKAANENLSRDVLKEKTYRKQLLAAVDDVRVLCLKFWDRIDNLQTIGALPASKQSLIAEETRKVYVPLALHLGMGYVSTELDSLSLRILYPTRAQRYQSSINDIRSDTEGFLRKFRASIHSALDHQKISFSLVDRWRPFSIQAARHASRGLLAVYTLDIQVDHTMEAYMALGLIHGLYPPIPGKLRDHLSVPSQHGYQALKSTIQADEKRIRIEITTRKLARFNDSGVLAPGFEFRKANFKELMHSLLEGESAFDAESLRVASRTIQVYTPQGEMRVLPEGSCALDFAFDIHEELGLHAMNARINGRTRLLKSRLMDGDQISIARTESTTVLPKWLEWAVTPKARNSIRRYLRGKVKSKQG
jgi:GTP pyrophosphokinase